MGDLVFSIHVLQDHLSLAATALELNLDDFRKTIKRQNAPPVAKKDPGGSCASTYADAFFLEKQ